MNAVNISIDGVRFGVLPLKRLDQRFAQTLYSMALDRTMEDAPDGDPFWHEGILVGVYLIEGIPLLWVYESVHITNARLCPGYAKNAGDLENLSSDGYPTYTVPKDWLRRVLE